jgi:hypothetical protein
VSRVATRFVWTLDCRSDLCRLGRACVVSPVAVPAASRRPIRWIAAATAVTSRMRRFAILAVLLSSCLAPAVALHSCAPAGSAPASSAPRLLAFRGHFGGFHLGRGTFGRRGSRFGGFGRRNSSPGLVHRIARALAFAYLLHLFFSHGGLSILLWLVVIGLVVHFVRRRRRPRDQYSY